MAYSVRVCVLGMKDDQNPNVKYNTIAIIISYFNSVWLFFIHMVSFGCHAYEIGILM